MTTCKQCGKSGFFLSLNEKGLCRDCAKAGTRKTLDNNGTNKGKIDKRQERKQLIIDYIQEECKGVQEALIWNPNCPDYVLRNYEKIGLDTARRGGMLYGPISTLIYNRNVSKEWIEEIYEHYGKKYASAIASKPNAPMAILSEYYALWEQCLKEPDNFEINNVFERLACNPGIPEEWRKALLECDLFYARMAVAGHPRNTTDDLVRLVNRTVNEANIGKIRSSDVDYLGRAFMHRNMTRDAVVALGFHKSSNIRLRCLAAVNPNMTEADLFSLLGDISNIQLPSGREYSICAGYDQYDMAKAVVANPSATEAVHWAIIKGYSDSLKTGFSPYVNRMDGVLTPVPIIEHFAFDRDDCTAARWTGRSRKTIYHYGESTDSRYSEQYRSWAFWNHYLPEILFAEPEKDEYIKGLARRHRENPTPIQLL